MRSTSIWNSLFVVILNLKTDIWSPAQLWLMKWTTVKRSNEFYFTRCSYLKIGVLQICTHCEFKQFLRKRKENRRDLRKVCMSCLLFSEWTITRWWLRQIYQHWWDALISDLRLARDRSDLPHLYMNINIKKNKQTNINAQEKKARNKLKGKPLHVRPLLENCLLSLTWRCRTYSFSRCDGFLR